MAEVTWRELMEIVHDRVEPIKRDRFVADALKVARAKTDLELKGGGYPTVRQVAKPLLRIRNIGEQSADELLAALGNLLNELG